MLKSCCDVLKKTTDLNRFSTGFPGDHVEIMLFSCGFERWERPWTDSFSKIIESSLLVSAEQISITQNFAILLLLQLFYKNIY